MGDVLTILVVDDDSAVADVIADALAGHRVATASSGLEALRLMQAERFEVVLLDLRMPDMDGLEVLKTIKESGSESEVVILTGHADVDSAVTAMKLGAHDYLQKPVDLAKLERVVRRAGQLHRLKPLRTGAKPSGAADPPAMLLGVDPKMLAVRRIIARVAPAPATVLITGETGTGKELLARMIHEGSQRAAGPFIVLDCPSVPVSLFESEVFGHERGAFTGAVASRRGRLAEGDGGTLFLDEVGELTPEVQTKLLRFLQERRVTPVGGNRAVRVDARVISATNRDLAAMVEDGTFRADLFHRLNVVHIDLPPLRERKGDIPLLIAHFVEWFCRGMGVPGKMVSPECLGFLVGSDWPGNVRELENAVQQACLLTPGHIITPESLPPRFLNPEKAPDAGGTSGVRSLAEVDRQHILDVLRQADGNMTRAARVLGIHRATLYRRLMALGIRPASESRERPC